MSIPSRNYGLLVLLTMPFLITGRALPLSYALFWGANGALLLLLLVDYIFSRLEDGPEVSREAPNIWAVDLAGEYTIIIRNRLARRLSGTVDEHSYSHFQKRFKTQAFSLARGGEARLSVSFTPAVRGEIGLGPSFLRYTSRLGLWFIARRYDARETVRVFPHISDYLSLNPFLHRQRTYRRGQHAIRMLGEGTDFDTLRDYQPGDDYGKMNWKATARTGRPIVCQYRAERDREVIVALDGGRLMFAGIHGKSRFDRCLDAVAQFSYALRLEGDRLGLVLFDREIRFYSKPTRRPDVLADLYPFYPRHTESDFVALHSFIARRHAKRSLLFVFTEISDSISGRRAIHALASLAKKHQVVIIMMDDPLLYAAAVKPLATEKDLYRHASALLYLKERKRLCERLRRSGAEVVRTFAEKLNAEVINKYSELKARNLA